MPKTKNKIKTNFSKLARQLKPIVSFSVDLRKTDANRTIKKGKDAFSFGEKMNMLKARKSLEEYKNAGSFVPMKKEKGESKTTFKKRISQTRKEWGQGHTSFIGIFTDIPNFAQFKSKRIKNEAGIYTTRFESKVIGKVRQADIGFVREITKEYFVPVNPHKFAEDPKGYLDKLRGTLGPLQKVTPMHSAWRGIGTGLSDYDFNRFKNRLNKWAFKYESIDPDDADASKSDHWLTGFMITTYSDEVVKGVKNLYAKGKGKSKN